MEGGGGEGDHLAAARLGCGQRWRDRVVTGSSKSGTLLAAAARGGFPEGHRQWLQLHEGEDHLLPLASLQ
jgi:hypothetical protein